MQGHFSYTQTQSTSSVMKEAVSKLQYHGEAQNKPKYPTWEKRAGEEGADTAFCSLFPNSELQNLEFY